MSSIIDNLFKRPKIDRGVAIPHHPFGNEAIYQQTDTLYLPTDKSGAKYLLVVVDVGSRKVDAEPLKTKRSDEIVSAFKKIYDRGILKIPKRLGVDPGSELTNKVLLGWMKKKNIKVKIHLVGRHRQSALVESANKLISVALFKKMSNVEILTGKTSSNWVKYLPDVLKKLNSRVIKKPKVSDKPFFDKQKILPIGTRVRVALDNPVDFVTRKQLGTRFRATDARFDITPRKVLDVLIKPNSPVLYLLSDEKNSKKIEMVGRTRNQLQVIPKNEIMPSRDILEEDEQQQDEYVPEKVISDKIVKGKRMFRVRWLGFTAKSDTYEPVENLLDRKKQPLDVLREYLNA